MDGYKRESRFSKGGMFLVGFFAGMLAAAAVLFLLAGYVIRNPQAVAGKVAQMGMRRVVQKTVEAVPKEYVGEKQDAIASTAQNVAKAFSENRISPEDVQSVASRFFDMMSDQKLSPGEIDEMLGLINRAAE